MDGNQVDQNQEQADAEMEAAFAASFEDVANLNSGKTEPVAEDQEQKIVEQPKEENKDTQQAPPAIPALPDEYVQILKSIPQLEERLTKQVDRVAGNYGEIKRLLDVKQKAEVQKPTAAPSADPDYIDREFPELGEGIRERIKAAVDSVKPPEFSQDNFEEMYKARRQREDEQKFNDDLAIIDKSHPDRLDIIKTTEWKNWAETLPAHQVQRLENSQDPYYVIGMISKFKDHRSNQEEKAKKSQKRIENAVAPTGVKTNTHSSMTDDEAAQKAFEDQFK